MVKPASRVAWLLALTLSATSCGTASDGTGPTVLDNDAGALFCNVPRAELAFVLVPNAILSLANPPFVTPGHVDASYVAGSDRVVGLVIDDVPIAVPLNVLRFHEVVNLERGGLRLAVTYCPLTGSSLAFDRSGVGGAELRVSGILHHNNLVMFDSSDEPTFFTQMMRGAATCGPGARTGASLPLIPSFEMRWDAWQSLHPNTSVVSEQTGGLADYDVNPHVEYERPDNPLLLVPFPIDPRRPPKERILGIPTGGDGGPAFPFEKLRRSERLAISALNGSVVVLWDRSAEAAFAFSTQLDGEELGFVTTATGFADVATRSEWSLDGVAVAGPLAGRRLEQITDAYVSFWLLGPPSTLRRSCGTAQESASGPPEP